MGTLDNAGTYGTRGVTHAYSSVPVLLDVDFGLRAGSVHGLVGENGAGKSTLIKILFGAERPIRGHVYLDEKPVILHSPADALRQGVAVVHQDVQVFPELSVAKNVFGVGRRLPRRRRSRVINWKAVNAQVEKIFELFQLQLPVQARVGALGPVYRRMIEIARAMMESPRFLILDEPTASLEPRSASLILDVLDRLRDEGLGILFVSHRLDEVQRIADEVSVLRDGRLVGHLQGQSSEDEMAHLMLGAKAEGVRGARRKRPGRTLPTPNDPALEIQDLLLPDAESAIQLTLRRGEIFGLTGLLGSGAETIVRSVAGASGVTPGHMSVLGRRVAIEGPRDALAAGVGLVPEDRQDEGVVPEQSVAINIALSSLKQSATAGILRKARLRRSAREFCERLSIRCESLDVPIATLSGGNQQKVLIARCLASGAKILAIEEPTHGVDIGAKEQIHALIREFADGGGSVIVASTDVGELLHLCDRVGVCKHGTLSAILTTTDAHHSDVLLASLRDPEELIEELLREESGEQPTAEEANS